MPQRENHKSWSLDKFTVAAGGSHSPFTLQPTCRQASEPVMLSIWVVHPVKMLGTEFWPFRLHWKQQDTCNLKGEGGAG